MTEITKVVSMQEAVALIADGSHLTFSGFAITRSPVAFAHELIRQGKKELTVSQCIGAFEVDLLVGAGAIKKLNYAGGSLDRPGPLHNVNRAIVQQTVEVSEYSGLSMAMRFLAGSLGIPYMPAQTIFGSDILQNLLTKKVPEVSLGECPFTGEKLVLLKALRPDYAVIHVPKADQFGNAIIYGPRWDYEAAMAAENIIIVADELFSSELTAHYVQEITIPASRVKIVVHQPFGAHPTSVYGKYDYDRLHVEDYVSFAATPQGMKEYLDKHVYETGSFNNYLELIGGLKRLTELNADSLKKY
ncbi:MAG: CoA transferase subunit A [Dethiobacter sp.]|jgi:acyl CoA:acetate/3-ketoacid CoA transferase alpha subunit|nr:CoA transferase subunit A [Dethiobacter sp.]